GRARIGEDGKLIRIIAKKGGQLISKIHTFSTSHGDPFVHTFAERLLSKITTPFYDTLRRWISSGELSDPYQEFFVRETADPEPKITYGAFGGLTNFAGLVNPSNKAMASSVWESKYTLVNEMVPTVITEEVAKKIYLIGKSLNFIRLVCGDRSE